MDTKKLDDNTKPIAPFGTSPDLVLPGVSNRYLGLTLKDRYFVESELGHGGIGVVYLARDTQLLGRPVVIKVLLEEADATMNNPWFRRKFEQEIEALVRLDHPGVVGVLDAGAMPDGKPFFVMQFVEGINLRAMMANQAMPFGRVAEIIRQLGQALSAIHDKGIVHRDVKPENIMVQSLSDDELQVKIIDFGIATVKDSATTGHGERTKVAGALPYMAPEQLRGAPEIASDIWSLSVTAYEMLTGRLPYYADTLVHLYELQRIGVGAKPTELRTDLPPRAEKELLKALKFEPHERHVRAREFGEALAKALTTDSRASRSEASSVAPSQMPEPTTSLAPEIAHVLFMDLVGYSKLPMDEQAARLKELGEIVRQTSAFSRARERDRVLSLPTGDGMALVFFGDPSSPVDCAIEMASALKERPDLPLRIGLHSGPVYRVADINLNRNVAGGGINLAQRVMDCGDAGHILVSSTFAEMLRELGRWNSSLQDLGEHEVKHGLRVRIFNLVTDKAGNPSVPEKLRTVMPTSVFESPREMSAPRVTRAAEFVDQPIPKAKPLPLGMIAGLSILAIALIAGAVWYIQRPTGSVASSSDRPPAQVESDPLLSYSITSRRNPKRYPNEKARELVGEIMFTPGDELRVNVTSRKDGHLYIINEGPQPQNGLPSYNVLFPAENVAPASVPSVRSNQSLSLPAERPPWFHVDDKPGTEKLWLIWSEQAVEPLEKVRKWLNPQAGGKVKNETEIRSIQEFLDIKWPTSKPVAEKGETQTNLKGGSNGLLIYLLKLEHL